ncbi:MAG TPA: helix-hairpin-helix domain-containing protein, partial [Bacteroidales bacterium]|nr:helix-hairpin-helix domain-containing protein [Bacteroidales bacterium]
RTPADLYKLQYDDIIKLERFAEKSSRNLLASIEGSKKIPFPKVLYALGIRYVGQTVAKKLAVGFGNIDALMNASHETLTEVEEIGDRIAESVINFFAEEANAEMIMELRKVGLKFEVNAEENAGESQVLKDKTIVISGTFEQYSRNELKEMIEKNGGKNTSSISSKTSYVLAGENMGPEKKKKAESHNVPIIDIDSFLKLLKD